MRREEGRGKRNGEESKEEREGKKGRDVRREEGRGESKGEEEKEEDKKERTGKEIKVERKLKG